MPALGSLSVATELHNPELACRVRTVARPQACQVPTFKIIYPPRLRGLDGLGQPRVQEIPEHLKRRRTTIEPSAPGPSVRWPFWVGLATLAGAVLLWRRKRPVKVGPVKV